MSDCVSKLWHRTAKDERLWELICTRHSTNIGCGTQQLRSVALPLGSFRRLHSLYLWALSKPHPPPVAAAFASFSKMINSRPATRWGKDEILTCIHRSVAYPATAKASSTSTPVASQVVYLTRDGRGWSANRWSDMAKAVSDCNAPRYMASHCGGTTRIAVLVGDTKGFVIPSFGIEQSNKNEPVSSITDVETSELPQQSKTEENDIYLGPHGAPPQPRHQASA